MIRIKLMPSRVIQIKVKPNSRSSLLEQNEDGTWLAQIKSPPVDGKANAELIVLVAKHFQCRKSDVTASSSFRSAKIAFDDIRLIRG